VEIGNPVVAHLVSADTPADRGDTLAALLAAPAMASAQFVLHIGPGKAKRFNRAPVARVHALPLRGLQAYAVRRALCRCSLFDSGRPLVVHAWTPDAASGYVPLAATHRPLLLEVGSDTDLRSIAAWSSSTCLGLVCPTATVQERLRDLGVPATRCALVYPAASPGGIVPARRSAIRAQLGLSDLDLVITALPPVTRRSGTFIATWAALLLEKVRPEVRLIIPAGGRELDRVWRLVVACRHESVARRVPPELPLADLLAASDLAAYLPIGDAPLSPIALAMAAGCPLVATDVPVVTEVLSHGRNAWLCRPGDPADATRTMLRALEDQGQSRRQAQNARAAADTLFAPARMLEQYRRAYANLAARRPLGAND
jgi:glycosyltransferase involved in cell wall biosynthesis